MMQASQVAAVTVSVIPMLFTVMVLIFSPKRFERSQHPWITRFLACHWMFAIAFYGGAALIVALGQHKVLATVLDFVAQILQLDSLAIALEGPGARMFSLPLLALAIYYTQIARYRDLIYLSAWYRFFSCPMLLYLILVSVLPTGCAVIGAVDTLGAAWSFAYLRVGREGGFESSVGAVGSALGLPVHVNAESSSSSNLYAHMPLAQPHSQPPPTEVHVVELHRLGSEKVPDQHPYDTDQTGSPGMTEKFKTRVTDWHYKAGLGWLWGVLQSTELGGAVANSALHIGGDHFREAAVVNIFVDSGLLIVLISQQITWSVLNAMYVTWAVSTHAFLWCCMFRVDSSWWGPYVGLLHSAIEVCTAALTVSETLRDDPQSTKVSLSAGVVLGASGLFFVAAVIYCAATLGFFASGKPKVNVAFFVALMLHYPGLIATFVSACALSARGAAGAYVIWIGTVVWVAHLSYEWFALCYYLLGRDQEQRGHMTIVTYGIQICLTAVFVTQNQYY